MKEDVCVEQLRKDIINGDIVVKRLVQDVYNCKEQDVLNDLNAEGRNKLANLRENIERLSTVANETKDELLSTTAANFREQFYSTFGAFKKANVEAMLSIEKANKMELFGPEEDPPSVALRRRKKDRAALVNASSNVTGQLASISRQLAEITENSGSTLGALTASGEDVSANAAELSSARDVIRTSGSLLDKYSRRQLTDRLLVFLGIVFFAACCLYIIRKRMFS